MTPFTSIHRLAHPIGLDIGRSNSEVQGELLNGVAQGLMEGGYIEADLDRQCAYITDSMTHASKALIVRLARFCEPSEAVREPGQ